MENVFPISERAFMSLPEKHGGLSGLEQSDAGWRKLPLCLVSYVICWSASGNKYDSPYEQVEFDESLFQS